MTTILVTGTITEDRGALPANLFGPGSLIGDAYTETISPDSISTTVNGHTFSWIGAAFSTRYYLDPDQLYQDYNSAGCGSAYGFCVNSYVLVSTDPHITSNTYFMFRTGPAYEGAVDQYTGFYGSIATVAIVPEPSTLALFLLGFAVLWIRKRLNLGGLVAAPSGSGTCD